MGVSCSMLPRLLSLRRQFCWALASRALSRAGQRSGHFQPAGLESPHGDVKRVRFSTGLVELTSHTLVHSPPGSMRDFRFSEPVWVIWYRLLVFGADGLPADNSYLCHTFFGDQRVVQRQDQRMRALYSDGFTREVMMPEGFGVPFTPLDRVHWMPMFNNRSDRTVQVEMRIEVVLIRDKDLKKIAPTVFDAAQRKAPASVLRASERQIRGTLVRTPV